VLAAPVEYANDAVLALIAEKLLPKEKKKKTVASRDFAEQQRCAFNIFGADYIEQGALHQMYAAANCPVGYSRA